MSNKEYERMSKRLEYNVATRVNLLTASFTTVLATLCLAFTVRVNQVTFWIFLIPYFLIIPFSARIVYYRIVYARMYSFMMVFSPDDMQFAIKGKNVPEDEYPHFWIINILNNYELFLLSCANTIIFWCKYPVIFAEFTIDDWLICTLPIMLTLLVGWIVHYGYRYVKWEKRYFDKWETLIIANVKNITKG